MAMNIAYCRLGIAPIFLLSHVKVISECFVLPTSIPQSSVLVETNSVVFTPFHLSIFISKRTGMFSQTDHFDSTSNVVS